MIGMAAGMQASASCADKAATAQWAAQCSAAVPQRSKGQALASITMSQMMTHSSREACALLLWSRSLQQH